MRKIKTTTTTTMQLTMPESLQILQIVQNFDNEIKLW